MDINKMYDQLPKYLYCENGKKAVYYQLVFIKRDWDGYNDSCIARYSRVSKNFYAKNGACLEATGKNLEHAISNMYNVCKILEEEGCIRGNVIDIPPYRYDKQFNARIGIEKNAHRRQD